MSSPHNPTEAGLRKAAELIKAGQKKMARQLLRELLIADNQNLGAWELLVFATYNIEEKIFCLKRILSLRPNHPWARQRLIEASQEMEAEPVPPSTQDPFPRTGAIAAVFSKQDQQGIPLTQFSLPPQPTIPTSSRPLAKQRKIHRAVLWSASTMLAFGCIALLGVAIARAGYLARIYSPARTSTASLGTAQVVVQPGLGITPFSTAIASMSSPQSLMSTSTPTRTAARTNSPTRTYASTPINTLTRTPTASRAHTPTQIHTATDTPTIDLTPTITPAFTFTAAPIDTASPVPDPSEPVCSNVTTTALTAGNKDLSMTITNNNGTDVTIDRIFVRWIISPPPQRLNTISLAGNDIMTTTTSITPSDFPTDGAWTGQSRLIANGNSSALVVTWQNPIGGGTFSIAVILDIGCQVQASISLP